MALCLPTSKHSINNSWFVRNCFVVCLNWEKLLSCFLYVLSIWKYVFSPLFSFLFDGLADLLVIATHFSLVLSFC